MYEKFNVTPEQNNVRTVSFLGVKISLASFLSLIAGIIVAVLTIFVAPKPFGIFFGLVLLGSACLAAYNVNCTQVGHCHVWAWILAVIYIIGAVGAIGKFVSNKPIQDARIESFKSAMSSKKSSVKSSVKSKLPGLSARRSVFRN
jgi:hypothetical protein